MTSRQSTPDFITLRFSDEVTLLRALARQFEGDAADALDLVGVVDLRVDAALLAIAEIDNFLGFAEIDAARQFAHDHDVEPVDQFALQRGGVGERRIADRRTQIGEEAKILAQPQQARFGADFVRDAVPFGAADGGEQHGVRRPRQFHVGFADRLFMDVISRSAHEAGLGSRTGHARLVQKRQNLFRLRGDFRADAVAREE